MDNLISVTQFIATMKSASQWRITLLVLVIFLLTTIPNNALCQSSSSTSSQFISIVQKEGKYWLLDSSGNPFFAHGVNHVSSIKDIDMGDVSEACKKTLFNAYGYGCPTALHDDLPYMESWNDLAFISLHRSAAQFTYLDVFDDDVIAGMRQKISDKCVINKNNKNLIGYLWTDLPSWTLDNKHNTNWVIYCRELSTGAAGKIKYVEFLKDLYNEDFSAFNALYQTNVSDWNALLAYDFTLLTINTTITADDLKFLRLIARQYFSVVGNATKEFDPNHLIFGDRFSFALAIDEVIEEMLPYVDAIAVQPNYAPNFPSSDFKALHQRTNKPILICDFAMRFDDGVNQIQGNVLDNEQVAADAYVDYLTDAFDESYVLGSFWCNLLDKTQSSGLVKQGFYLDEFRERPIFHQAVLDLNRYFISNTPSNDVSITNSADLKFRVYPNPVTEYLTVESEYEDATLSVFDANGQQIYQTDKFLKNTTINLKAHPAGVYVIRITAGKKVKTRMVIKQ